MSDIPAGKQCPEVAEAAWCELAQHYRAAVGPSTEASDNFHLATFLTIAGALLGRLVYYNNPKPLYPNFFTMLVGKSGARKDTAIDFAEDVAWAVNRELWWVRGVNSGPGCVESLANRQVRSAILRFSEFSIPYCKASELPTVSVLGRTEPCSIDNLKIDDLEGGFGNPFWWIPGRAKKWNFRPPAPNLTPIISELGTVLSFWLEKVGGAREKGTAITMDEEAARSYEQWHTGLDLFYRMEVHCPKVAMLHAALDRRDVIRGPDIRSAIAFCEFLIECIAYICPDWAEARQDQLLAML